MKIYILTDLEGAAGVSMWEQTRAADSPIKPIAMELLTREVNACIDGILDFDCSAEIVAWDGHGSGGILTQFFHPRARLIHFKGTRIPNGLDQSFDAMFYVGQHAMAGTPEAPLCHTYSSKTIEYYKLNGKLIGEIGCRLPMAGMFDVPIVFLSGDDKACREFEALVPDAVTVATKQGTGIESAVHLSSRESCRQIRLGARRACGLIDKIKPAKMPPPYELEIRVLEGCHIEDYLSRGARALDPRTVLFQTDDLLKLPI